MTPQQIRLECLKLAIVRVGYEVGSPHELLHDAFQVTKELERFVRDAPTPTTGRRGPPLSRVSQI